MRPKAQVSIEYLLLFAVSLVILIIIMQGLSYISGMINGYETRSHSLIAKELFLSTAREACYIGSGTSLAVQLSDAVEIKEGRINNIPYEMPCGIAEGNYSGRVLIQNRNNQIIVK